MRRPQGMSCDAIEYGLIPGIEVERRRLSPTRHAFARGE